MIIGMSSAWKKPFQRLWQRVKGAKSKKKKDSNHGNSVNRKSSNDCSNRRESVWSANNSDSAEVTDDTQTHRHDSLGNSVVRSGPLADDKDDWESISADESEFELLSSNRRGSLALDEILLDNNSEKRKENSAKKPDNKTTGADNELEPNSKIYNIDGSVTHSKANLHVNSSGKKADSRPIVQKHKNVSANVLSRDSEFAKNKYLDSLINEEDFIKKSKSADVKVNEPSSNLRKGTHVVGRTGKTENVLNTFETDQAVPFEEHADVDVKAIIDAISGRGNIELSEKDDESDNSTTQSEVSDLEDDSSDEESDHEVFDLERYIDELIKRQNEEKDRNWDNVSENVSKIFVRKVSKKTKRVLQAPSDKGSETEASPINDDSNSDASGREDDPGNGSSWQGFECERDVYFLADNEHISSSSETVKKKLAPENGGYISKNERGIKSDVNSVRRLKDRRAEDLRWPLSIFYVKEFKQGLGMLPSHNGEVLPSYMSTVASARQPGRKRNVVQGRVWWVEWWAKEDSRKKEGHKVFRHVRKTKK